MATDRINIDEYLSNFSPKRRFDNAIKFWITGTYGHGLRSKSEWDKIIDEFFSAPAEGKIEKKEEKPSIPVKESKKIAKDELFEEE